MNWLRSHTRAIFWCLYVVGLALGLSLIVGCANTPVERSTDTPVYQMREGQAVVVQFQPAEKIAAFARANIDAAYKVDAVAFPGEPCVVWMKPGWVNLYLLNHELAHCAGLRHSRFGIWEN